MFRVFGPDGVEVGIGAGGGLTDAELRATPVPVSGPLTDTQLRATAVPVSGTVGVTGVATAANQATEIAGLASIDSSLASIAAEDFATQTTLALIKAKTDNLDVALSTRAVTGLTDTQLRATAVPVSGPLTDTQLRATAVPVSGTVAVTGVATAANQATEIASLASIDGKDFATQTTLALIKAKTDNLDVALSTRTKPADAQHVIADSGTITTVSTVTAVTAISNALPAGNNNIGDVDVATLPALVAGGAVIGKVGIDQTTPGTTNLVALAANQSVNVAQINGVTPLMGAGNTGTGSPRVTIATDQAAVATTPAGNVAHDAVDSGNPIKIGGKAAQANPTAVAALDRVDAMYDDLGRQVVVLSHVRDLISHQYTQVVNSTAETTIVSATASEFHDWLMLTIKSSAAVTATFKDSTGGATRMVLAASANSQTIPFPVPFPQLAAVNNNWTMTLSNNTTTVDITVMFAKNV